MFKFFFQHHTGGLRRAPQMLRPLRVLVAKANRHLKIWSTPLRYSRTQWLEFGILLSERLIRQRVQARELTPCRGGPVARMQ